MFLFISLFTTAGSACAHCVFQSARCQDSRHLRLEQLCSNIYVRIYCFMCVRVSSSCLSNVILLSFIPFKLLTNIIPRSSCFSFSLPERVPRFSKCTYNVVVRSRKDLPACIRPGERQCWVAEGKAYVFCVCVLFWLFGVDDCSFLTRVVRFLPLQFFLTTLGALSLPFHCICTPSHSPQCFVCQSWSCGACAFGCSCSGCKQAPFARRRRRQQSVGFSGV